MAQLRSLKMLGRCSVMHQQLKSDSFLPFTERKEKNKSPIATMLKSSTMLRTK
jgi:hypothetical protein